MSSFVRRIFRLVNKFFMVPAFRLGFGPIFGNPFTGYIMVLKTIGRKTGLIRYVPVNYTIYQGKVYCISGLGKKSHWYLNLRTKPDIELILPGGSVYARMAEVEDPEVRRIITRQTLINAGFAGYFEGYNPRSISDEDLQRKTADMPILCFQLLGLGNGPSDAGGWAWIPAALITMAAIWALMRFR